MLACSARDFSALRDSLQLILPNSKTFGSFIHSEGVLLRHKIQSVVLFQSEEVSTKILPNRIRNVGIVAHIDAGKTTITERMLYLAGVIKHMGDVDTGNTVTDFLDLERERGITIQSAAITFNWKKHRINLVDTPGHVDFSIEVERCTRILDGIITVLDGSAGVQVREIKFQAQTITVWRQAAKFRLPSLFFINKLDRKVVDFQKSVDSVEQKLGIRALVVSFPFYNGEVSSFVVDALSKTYLPIRFDGQWSNIESKSHIGEVLNASRESLCCNLADLDPGFMSTFLEQYNGDALSVPAPIIIKALRRLTLSNSATVLSCGSALRCPASVQTVLDHTVYFLPSPDERNSAVKNLFQNELCILVFKIVHDKRKGKLSFVRVYSGELKNNSLLYNSTRRTIEGPIKLFIAHSSEFLPISCVNEGNIAVVSGLSCAVTGDTILSSEAAACHYHPQESLHIKHSEDGILDNNHPKLTSDYTNDFPSDYRIGVNSSNYLDNPLLKGVDNSEPVYFCCIEPPSSKSSHDFEKALKELAVEDPSLRIRFDSELGQTVIETMGELHLDIVKSRLNRDYGLEVFVGPLQFEIMVLLLARVITQ
ncbi:putative translation elongation factor G [Dictyocaulus viviparus]|uniref:Putative translation elongation factor G n=1 Tax=Dictyocaulus viviparus TaxID=29172 RepID=A0A0D8XGF4_DICVI|nr:putative translation elongation factor G [Dictyocaulus viviparus]